jgi:hypothetical protein
MTKTAMTKIEYRSKVLNRIEKIASRKNANFELPQNWDKLYFDIDIFKRAGQTVGQCAKTMISKHGMK